MWFLKWHSICLSESEAIEATKTGHWRCMSLILQTLELVRARFFTQLWWASEVNGILTQHNILLLQSFFGERISGQGTDKEFVDGLQCPVFSFSISLTSREGRLQMQLLGTKWINICLKIQIVFCSTITLGLFFQNSILMSEKLSLTKYSCKHLSQY